MPQGLVLGPLLFLIYISSLNEAISHSIIRHFADDTNILTLKKINRYINHDLSQIVHWLIATKISLNASKTEIILFRQKTKAITKYLNFRISGHKINIVKQTTEIMKFKDILAYDNCIFVHDQLNENLPESFSNVLTTAPVQHNYNN